MALEVEITDVRDDVRFDRRGDTIMEKRVMFHIGKHGPFVERFAAGEFTSAAVQARIQQLKTHLELLGAK